MAAAHFKTDQAAPIATVPEPEIWPAPLLMVLWSSAVISTSPVVLMSALSVTKACTVFFDQLSDSAPAPAKVPEPEIDKAKASMVL